MVSLGDGEGNPTINTLERYAAALGKQMIVLLADLPVGWPPGRPRLSS